MGAATVKLTINPDAYATVVKVGDDGSVTSWDMAPRQLAKHLRGIAQAAHPFNGLSPGDKSAAADAANQAAQSEK